MKTNHWIRENEKTLLDSPFMRLESRTYRSSEDPLNRQEFFVFRSRDWCNVIPITHDRKIVLVKQFRIGIEKHTDEIPGGVIDIKDRDPQAAALRELTEETGYTLAANGKCQFLGSLFPNPAIQDNRQHFYVAGPVEKSAHQNLDVGEMIEVVEVPMGEIAQWIADGKITHALHMAAFMLLLAKSPQLSTWLETELSPFA